MADTKIYTYLTWICNDGTPGSMGSITAPVQITPVFPGFIVDQSVELKNITSTLLYDTTAPANDSDWTWMAFWSEVDVRILYIGTADSDSSAFLVKAGTLTVMVANEQMDYNADDQIRLVNSPVSITKLWAYQTSGATASVRFVYGV